MAVRPTQDGKPPVADPPTQLDLARVEARIVWLEAGGWDYGYFYAMLREMRRLLRQRLGVPE